MSGRPINIALVGAGEWSLKYHIPTIQALSDQWNLRVRGVWNRTKQKAEECARRYGVPRVYESLQELVDDPGVDCRVVVVSRTALAGILEVLSERSLPFLCEKPPGASGSEARSIAGRVSVPNVVAFNRRYSPLNRKLREIMEAGSLEPHYAECSLLRRARNDEHFVTETGIHAINYLEALFGPVRTAQTDMYPVPGTQVHNRVVDVVFSSGVRGVMKFFPYSGIAVERYEIQGMNHAAYLHTAQHYTDEDESALTVNREGPTGSLDSERFTDEGADPLVAAGFVGEYEDFFRAVRDPRHETLSNFGNAVHSMLVAEAIEAGTDFHDEV
ncbi:MAG: gfo/Idh/MocA family oxidoreductase [Spirochaetaceae bacterium]|nr:MAG: gfo/Idh/MocA family oxidoreductase [Spirochaetaceae bacterium]